MLRGFYDRDLCSVLCRAIVVLPFFAEDSKQRRAQLRNVQSPAVGETGYSCYFEALVFVLRVIGVFSHDAWRTGDHFRG